MAEPLHRTQILLREDQHRALVRRAEREKTSMSELIRSLIDDELRRRDSERSERIRRRKAALDGIRKHHDEMLASRQGRPIDVDPAELVRQIREERDDELFGRLDADRR
jgi:hypothetical protein